MNRKFKALGLALFAALALSAVSASAASATFHFTAPNAPTVGTGTQEGQNIFTTEAGTVTCNTATFAGTTSNTTSNDLTVTPHYTGCTAFGFATTHINLNGCDYTFTTPEIFHAGTGKYTGPPPHVICGSGSIEVTPTFPIFGGSVCTVTIGAQTPTSGTVDYTNKDVGGLKHVLVTSTVTGIHYIVDGGGGVCGGTGVTKNDGKYEGSVTLLGYDDSNSNVDNQHNSVRESVLIQGT